MLSYVKRIELYMQARQRNVAVPASIEPYQQAPGSPIISVSDEDMPVCYCCSIETGLYLTHLFVGFMCLFDAIFLFGASSASYVDAGMAGNVAFFDTDIYFSYGCYIIWCTAILSSGVGALAVSSSPGPTKGLLLGLWRKSLIALSVMWTCHKLFTATKFSNIEWIAVIRSFKDAFLLGIPPDSWVDGLFWQSVSTRPFPLDLFFVIAYHYYAYLYLAVVIPMVIIASALSHMGHYSKLTKGGLIPLAEGIQRSKAIRRAKLAEKRALLDKGKPEF